MTTDNSITIRFDDDLWTAIEADTVDAKGRRVKSKGDAVRALIREALDAR